MLMRSVLYVPASNARAREKAVGLDCDAVILDLEDAVAPADKDAARQGLARIGGKPTLVRINARDSAWHNADLAAANAADIDGVVVPKIFGPADLVASEHPLWAMIETPMAVLNIATIARDPRVAGLILGLNDLALETGIKTRAGFAPVLSQAVMAARAYGKVVLDGVYNRIADLDGLMAECREAAEHGFDGKTLIHPDQITPCNTTFRPSDEDVAEARRLIGAYEAAGGGAVLFEGRMVEALHVTAANRVLGRR